MQDAKQRQSGGVVVFIVVGLVLATLLGGAIYLSKQQGRVASRTDTVATNDQKTEDTSTENPKNDTSKDDDKNENKGNASPTPAPAQPAPTTPTPAGGSGTMPTTGPSHIATTGPEDAVVPGLGLALLAAGVVSHRRSRRAVRTQALKQ